MKRYSGLCIVTNSKLAVRLRKHRQIDPSAIIYRCIAMCINLYGICIHDNCKYNIFKNAHILRLKKFDKKNCGSAIARHIALHMADPQHYSISFPIPRYMSQFRHHREPQDKRLRQEATLHQVLPEPYIERVRYRSDDPQQANSYAARADYRSL